MVFSPQSHEGHRVTQSVSRLMPVSERENAAAKVVVDCAFKIHKSLGPGLLESAYQECMVKELEKRGVQFRAEYEAPLFYEGDRLKTPYRVDLLVDDSLIVELKSVEKILPIHEAQTLTYLRLSGLRLGLLINFSVPLIKDGIRRLIV
jgi:GxxExxY protein